MPTNPPEKSPVVRFRAKRFIRNILDIVIPPVCSGCRTKPGEFCAACTERVAWVRHPICTFCGNRVRSPQIKACFACQQQTWRQQLCKVRCAVWFDGPVRRAVHALKYEGRFGVAKPLAKLMMQAAPNWRPKADLIVPVPLHAQRHAKRTYNQSELVAKQLSAEYGIPVAATSLLRRRNTTPQVTLKSDERVHNMKNAFHAVESIIKGRRVLLIDDVVTTGATIYASAEALQQAGATYVSAYCLARAERTGQHTLQAMRA